MPGVIKLKDRMLALMNDPTYTPMTQAAMAVHLGDPKPSVRRVMQELEKVRLVEGMFETAASSSLVFATPAYWDTALLRKQPSVAPSQEPAQILDALTEDVPVSRINAAYPVEEDIAPLDAAPESGVVAAYRAEAREELDS